MRSQERVYLLDVEGTVTPISLVTEQLFPYARAHFEEFLEKYFAGEGVKAEVVQGRLAWDLQLLMTENLQEQEVEAPKILPASAVTISTSVAIPRILAYVNWLMDRDRKSTALKSLQGKIWKIGFEEGKLKGTLFPDVPVAFARWAKLGRIAIYSSGSVEAQQLLFRHSTYGDLTPLIASYFDTRTGAKSESASYSTIAAQLQIRPAEVIFFSDVVRELDAAQGAGLQTRLVRREGNASVDDAHGHQIVETFEGI
jgi:enolase-phosphatase E1